jgi:hypothetical protein
MGYRLRVNRKNLGRCSPQRDEQFGYIGARPLRTPGATHHQCDYEEA